MQSVRKKYSCLIKREGHNKTRIYINELFLVYQCANLYFDLSFVQFGAYLVELFNF